MLKNPEPFVLFAGFGDSSLDFELRVFLADVNNLGIVQNDLRFGILEAFAKENIEIPFPQRDLNIRPGAGETLAGATTTRRRRRWSSASGRRRPSRAGAPKRRGRSRRPDPE